MHFQLLILIISEFTRAHVHETRRMLIKMKIRPDRLRVHTRPAYPLKFSSSYAEVDDLCLLNIRPVPCKRQTAVLLWTTISAVGILNAAFVMLSGNSHRKRRLIEESSAIKVSRMPHMINKRKSRKHRRFWERPGRSSTWWDNILSGFVVQGEWRKNFKMSKESFFNLCNQLRPFLKKKNTPTCALQFHLKSR